jgi:dihydrofolate reductase
MSKLSKLRVKLTNYVFIATSLDGFIAEKGGGLDWLNEIPNPNKTDYGYTEFINGIDALVMGRKTFEKVLTFDFWPYEKPVFVLSNSLDSVPEGIAGMTEIMKGDLRTIVDQLKKREFHNLYVDGGRVIQSFLRKDLIDEMIISWVPIILGSGIPLFGELGIHMKFRLVKAESFDDTLVKCHYVRIRV